MTLIVTRRYRRWRTHAGAGLLGMMGGGLIRRCGADHPRRRTVGWAVAPEDQNGLVMTIWRVWEPY